MNKYTVIYRDFFTKGSHTNSIVRVSYLEVPDGSTIVDVLKRENVESTQIEVVFAGHCKGATW